MSASLNINGTDTDVVVEATLDDGTTTVRTVNRLPPTIGHLTAGGVASLRSDGTVRYVTSVNGWRERPDRYRRYDLRFDDE
ncbi:MAG: hypothetical protein R8G01_22350 [Ilumatobacteraceae bacterium]|nr:hypothetical protein [Ilumatobacteraceae bacterium]